MRLPRLRLLTITLACGLLAIPGLSAQAATKKIKAPPPEDMRKLIKSVDAGAGTVTIQYMNTQLLHTYKIDLSTQIKVNGTSGKFGDIKPGLEVSDYTERDNDDLDSLSLVPATPPPATPKK